MRNLFFFGLLLSMFCGHAWAQNGGLSGPGPIARSPDALVRLAQTRETANPTTHYPPDQIQSVFPGLSGFVQTDGNLFNSDVLSLRAGFNGIDDHGTFVPDPSIAVGPASLVIVSNDSLAIQDKAGNYMAPQMDLRAFFAGVRFTREGAFDPRIVFDNASGRFFIAAIGSAPCTPGPCTSHLLLAVSRVSNPTTLGSNDWYFYAFDATLDGVTPTNNGADFTGLGVNTTAIVITAQMLAFNDGSFKTLKARVFDKSRLIQGLPADWTDFVGITDPFTGQVLRGAFQPGVQFDGPDTIFLINSTCGVQVWGITNPLSSPTLSVATAPGVRCDVPPDAAQPGGGTPIDTGSNALMSPSVYRNGSIWAAQTVGAGAVSAVRWAQIDVSNFPNSVSFVQQSSFGSDGVWYFYPAITVDAANNAVIVFIRSSSDEFASIHHTGRLATDPPGTLRPSTLLKAGSAALNLPEHNRGVGFGDYSTMALDPTDQSFWMFGEYAKASNAWGTWVGNVATGTASSPLLSAVLPSSRSATINNQVTAFATIINTGSAMASSCSIAPALGLPLAFHYQSTDPSTNAVIGISDTPVDIAAGASQSFVIGLTPSAMINPTDLPFAFACVNTAAAPVNIGLNTLLLSASTTPTPDIVALAATTRNDGTLHVTAPQSPFAVATVNVGAAGPITAATNTGSVTLPLTLGICQTNPSTGECVTPISSSVTTTINANATPTFGIFGSVSTGIPFDPAGSRIFVTFSDSGGAVRGETSVAVTTQ